jgi:ketosteroid isomerase-like protein
MHPEGRWIDELFAAIDRKDTAAFADFLAEDGSFRFGNAEAVIGRAAIAETVASFFAAIGSLNHRVEERWLVSGGAVVTGRVRYTRRDGSCLEVPFANVFKRDDDGIHDYRIYVDNSELFTG